HPQSPEGYVAENLGVGDKRRESRVLKNIRRQPDAPCNAAASLTPPFGRSPGAPEQRREASGQTNARLRHRVRQLAPGAAACERRQWNGVFLPRVVSCCRTLFLLTAQRFFKDRANVFGRHSGAIVRCALSCLAEEIGK